MITDLISQDNLGTGKVLHRSFYFNKAENHSGPHISSETMVVFFFVLNLLVSSFSRYM